MECGGSSGSAHGSVRSQASGGYMAGAGREHCLVLSRVVPGRSTHAVTYTDICWNVRHLGLVNINSNSVCTHLHALDVITGSPQLCSGAWVAAGYQQCFLPAPAACTWTGGQHWLWARPRQLRCCWPRALLLLLCIALAVLCWGRAGPACKHAASVWVW